MEQTLAQDLLEHPLTQDLRPDLLQKLAECAEEKQVDSGKLLWKQGESADEFYLIQSGRVALEISVPLEGPLQVETLGAGDVLGWSWLRPDHRWPLDARALTPLRLLRIEGDRLRQLMAKDNELGYEVLKRFAVSLGLRLQAARMRLLDSHAPRARTDRARR